MIFNTVIFGKAQENVGDTAKARLRKDIEDVSVGDKVLLTPSDEIVVEAAQSKASWTRSMGANGPAVPLGGHIIDSDQIVGYYRRWDNSNGCKATVAISDGVIGTTATVESLSSSDAGTFVDYRDNIGFAWRSTYTSTEGWKSSSAGIYKNGTYTQKTATGGDQNARHGTFSYVNSHYAFGNGYVGKIENGTDFYTYRATNADTTYYTIPSKMGDDWYIIHQNTVRSYSAPTTTVYNITGDTSVLTTARPSAAYTGSLIFLDDNVDYFIADSGTSSTQVWKVYKVIKADTIWTLQYLEDATNALAICSGDNGFGFPDQSYYSGGWIPSIRSKDFGDYVEIFMTYTAPGYNYEGLGNCVAHLILDKSTDKIRRLPDVFRKEELASVANPVSLQVNWDLGIVSYCGIGTGSNELVMVNKKFDFWAPVAAPYYAYPVKPWFFVDGTITGFVSSVSDSTDAYDDTHFKDITVSVAQDPDYEWSDVDKVFGMHVKVNGGEP